MKISFVRLLRVWNPHRNGCKTFFTEHKSDFVSVNEAVWQGWEEAAFAFFGIIKILTNPTLVELLILKRLSLKGRTQKKNWKRLNWNN